LEPWAPTAYRGTNRGPVKGRVDHDFMMTLLLASSETQHTMLLTMVTAIAAGVLLLVIARRLAFPSIVLLLGGGVLLGPMGFGVVQPDTLGDGLGVIVSLAIGLILFEGGLTLDLSGYRQASVIIKRLLTVGVVVTWLGSAAVIHFLGGQDLRLSIVAASLIIVTGPTVIAPLLKRLRVSSKLHSILHWEGVLIDPIGVFIAILCLEWLALDTGSQALTNFFLRFVMGIGIGAGGGLAIHAAIRRKLVPDDTVNVFALAMAILIFGLAEAVRSETGLLSVTVAGFVLGLRKPGHIKQIRQFKAEVTDLMIGMLFILLAARLSFDQFQTFGWRGALAVVGVMLLVRPLGIFLCGIQADLATREKLFLSWVAPRGIVAASLASLFAITLEQRGQFEDPKFAETFTYSVIMATIVIQGLSAGWVAQILGVRQEKPTGWLIVGAHALSRRLARFLQSAAERQVLLVDSNPRAIAETTALGLTALRTDALDETFLEQAHLRGIGNVLALTDNEELNILVCQAWAPIVGRANTYRWGRISADDEDATGRPGTLLAHLPAKPSLLASEMQRGETLLMESKGLPGTTTDITPVLGWDGKKVQVENDEIPLLEREGLEALLYLRRASNYLSRAIDPQLIVRLDPPDNVEALLAALLEHLCAAHPTLPREEMLTELSARHREYPMTLGEGVALPHAYSDHVKQRVGILARLNEGIEFGAADGRPVRLVFLLISPSGDPQGHLATIAEIARLVVDPKTRQKLIELDDPQEVLKVIRSIEPN
jgi:NhaP-type Na+/H+ or K+/H+ antiporter/mannitol/fructose-specific phosphotransferase system IIA component (Ntr-type)